MPLSGPGQHSIEQCPPYPEVLVTRMDDHVPDARVQEPVIEEPDEPHKQAIVLPRRDIEGPAERSLQPFVRRIDRSPADRITQAPVLIGEHLAALFDLHPFDHSPQDTGRAEHAPLPDAVAGRESIAPGHSAGVLVVVSGCHPGAACGFAPTSAATSATSSVSVLPRRARCEIT